MVSVDFLTSCLRRHSALSCASSRQTRGKGVGARGDFVPERSSANLHHATCDSPFGLRLQICHARAGSVGQSAADV
jgi:hypothetical protein